MTLAQPTKLRPTVMKVRPLLADANRWKRLTQRDYLLWALGAIHRAQYPATRVADAREVLERLNGMAGEW